MKISNRNIQESLAAVLVFLYIYTGLSKYQSLNTFQVVLGKSILIKAYSIPISLVLPGFEILLAIALAIPKTRRLGFLTSAYLLSAFTLYLLYMIKFSPKLPCSCGGIISQLSWRQHIILNTILIATSIYGNIITKKIDNNNQVQGSSLTASIN